MFGHNISITAAEDKIVLTCNGETIGETERAVRVHEPPLLPVYYVPRDDINMTFLIPSRHKTACPFKGDASYFTLEVDGERFENAAWSYESPNDEISEIKGFIAFYDSVVDVTSA